MDQFKAFSQQLNPLAAKLGKQFGQVKQVCPPDLDLLLFSYSVSICRVWSPARPSAKA